MVNEPLVFEPSRFDCNGFSRTRVKPILLLQNIILNTETALNFRHVQFAKGSSTSLVEHHNKTHIIIDYVMKPSKGLNGD